MGNFQLIADPVSFETVADLIRSVRLPQSPAAHGSPPRFQNLIPISTADLPKLRKGETLSLIGFEESQGRRLLRCEVLRKKAPLKLLLPMDCRGQFVECQDDQLYSIDTIVKWKLLAGRNRRVRVQAGHRLRLLSPLVPKHFSGYLVLHPYYSVKAYLPAPQRQGLTCEDGVNPPSLLHKIADQEMEVLIELRNVREEEEFQPHCCPSEIQINIPSDLDISVTEIACLDHKPRTTMRQIYSMEENKFPMRIKIMSMGYPKPLKYGQLLTILKTKDVKKFVATEISQGKKGRHFLIPYTYQGLVLRKGRFFYSVSDVAAAMKHGQLCFQASRDYTSYLGPSASFTAKECFLALKKSVVSAEIHSELHRVEVLKCLNIATKARVKLPLFAVGGFLELFDSAGPGTLRELCQVSRLPCHIKVTSPDPSMAGDPLYGTEELRIENVIVEQCLIAKDEPSLEDIISSEDIYREWPEATFEIPIEKSNCEVLVVEEQIAYSGKETRAPLQSIQEVTKASLAFSNCLIIPCPPPLPPKSRCLF
ncbi:Protein THEMIS3 [Apodemus speciosus]|uniref:Protein THEMIS3 n=1 Tax=Apodemus speciosus TaxID=105296 RepID=A0ABQ0FQ61_APOSI